MTPEIQVLFPGIREIAFSNTVTTVPGSEKLDTLHMAFVNAPGGISSSEREKLREYLELRLNEKGVHLTVNPAGFPWPKPEEERFAQENNPKANENKGK